MNPFKEKPLPLEKCIMDWSALRPKPYDARSVDPYTRTRVILMNGTEFEANWFSHQYTRHCENGDLRRRLALIRRLEQQQQKLIAALKPEEEGLLAHTIGYEQLAVDLTAWLARHEPDERVRNALDFALLEDFDHLYRYANLMDMEENQKAEDLVGRHTEIMPGRPTISEHRYPFDDIRPPIHNDSAQLQTKLCVGIITAAEQQTMNFYMNVCGTYPTARGRQLYQEIGMIEEQHVSQYGSLMDVNTPWLECLLMHQYTECYLYYSCAETETDPDIAKVWEMLYRQEVAHLHEAVDLLEKLEGKSWQQAMGCDGDFPEPLRLEGNIDYVRDVIARSVQLTAMRESYGSVDKLKPDAEFFKYQQAVNPDAKVVASHSVIEDRIAKFGEDGRFEVREHPIPALRERKHDNIDVGRKPGSCGILGQ